MPNRTLVSLAVGALTVVPTWGLVSGTAAASTKPLPAKQSTSVTGTSPTPGSAEAYALLIDPLLAVGHTKATAGSGSGSATGNSVELGGKPLIDGTTGGTQTGAGSKNGSLLDTGKTPLGQLQLTPWSAKVANSPDGSTTSDGDAALLRLFLIDPTVLQAAVLQSHSHATSNADGTSSSSSSDGAVVDAGNGQLKIDLLHAESSSGSKGSSYLVSINGNEIGSSDQANGSCTLSVPSVASLSCLTATGGTSGTTKTAGAAVGTATLGTGQAGGTVSGTSASGKSITGGSGRIVHPTTTSATASNSNRSGLPFTGMTLPPYLALGTFALAAGAWLQQASRRLRKGAVT